METLTKRRKISCSKFAKKAKKYEKFESWFKLSENKAPTKFLSVPYRTKWYKNSLLPYLTELELRIKVEH